MNHGFDPASDAAFRATMEAERRWTREQIGLLWKHNAQRREEYQELMRLINSTVKWFAVAAGGVLISIFRAKIGL